MAFRAVLRFFYFGAAVVGLAAGCCAGFAQASSSSSSGQTPPGQSSSSGPAGYVREKTPSLIDPAGPTISLISSEPVFIMAAALNACGYDEGLDESDPFASGCATR